MTVLLALQAATGARLWFVDLMGWEDSEMWMNTHLITCFGLIVLVAIHLYMNRVWVRAQFSGLREKLARQSGLPGKRRFIFELFTLTRPTSFDEGRKAAEWSQAP
jgi:Domain of unknown function (DUF4405)